MDVHRIEEASLNAWPAMHQVLLDGWVLRFARGFTKRSNSIIPLYPSRNANAGDADATLAKIRYCENLYAREQLQTVFRLTSIDPQLTTPLAQVLSERGYREADPSLVLASARLPATAPDEQVTFVPLEDWLAVYCNLTGMNEPARSLHRLILNAITGECGFAVLAVDGAPVACGLAVVEHELVGLFDVFTAAEQRQRGWGRVLVNGLLAWGYQAGARTAYLQVVAENNSARALYSKLGFSHLYQYRYYVSP